MLRFGTDGVRGDAASQLPADFVRAVARAAAVLGSGTSFLIGRDTRESGSRIAADFAAGLADAGVACEDLGVLPTPGIAYASQQRNLPAVVISASHNPWSDNGIKLFAPGGLKLDDATQDAIEAELTQWAAAASHAPEPARDPTVLDGVVPAAAAYLEHLVGSFDGRRLDGLRVVLDVANGASHVVAPEAFRRLGAEVIVLHDRPDGKNINAGCGSTHPEALQAAVLRHAAAVGFAFDGDADRCLGVDDAGAMIDGDAIIVALALDLDARGLLENRSVVVTVLSNLGLHVALRQAGISVVVTPVGDRAVMAAIDAGGYVLGGEQSGHIIVRDRATTGDGTLTALMFADLLVRSGRSAAQLRAQMTPLPQVMLNVRVPVRPDLDAADELWEAVRTAESELGDTGRVLVRASGTEPLIRVMVEAATEADAVRTAERLAEVVRHLPAS